MVDDGCWAAWESWSREESLSSGRCGVVAPHGLEDPLPTLGVPGAGSPTNSSGVRGGLAFSFYSSSSAHRRLSLDGGWVEAGRVASPGGGLHGVTGRHWGRGGWCQQGGLGHPAPVRRLHPR